MPTPKLLSSALAVTVRMPPMAGHAKVNGGVVASPTLLPSIKYSTLTTVPSGSLAAASNTTVAGRE